MNTIKTYLEKNKGVATIIAAKELGVPEKDVIDTLTEGVTPVSIDNFDEIMNEVSTWGDMTIIVTNNSVIFEVKGSLPQGSYARGFFNLHGSGGHIGGHLMSEKFTKIYFVDRPFMGKESLSIQIYDDIGDAAIKLYLGRDDKGEIKADQKQKYQELQSRYEK